jgi:putative oxidoreductase
VELVPLVFRFIIASVFVLAGLAKLPFRREFARLVRRYGLLPPRLVTPTALALPPLELLAGLFLLVGFATRPMAVLVGLVLCAFSGAVAINLLRGNEIDCGCFTMTGPSRLSWMLVARNLVLVSMAAVVALRPPGALSVDAALFGLDVRGVSAGDALACLALGFALFGLAAIVAESRRAYVAMQSLRASAV